MRCYVYGSEGNRTDAHAPATALFLYSGCAGPAAPGGRKVGGMEEVWEKKEGRWSGRKVRWERVRTGGETA